MKKSITIVGYSIQSLNVISEQIKNVFGENIFVRKITVDDLKEQCNILSDLILFPSYSLYNKTRNSFNSDDDIVIMSRTISKEGFDKLKSISTKDRIYLIDETKEMAEEICGVIYQLGIRHLNIKPLTYEVFKEKQIAEDDVLINLNKELEEVKCKIVNIGKALLDINSIIEIGIRLDLDHILKYQDLMRAYKEIITSKIGLALVLNKTNSYVGQIKILLDSTDDGIIEFDTDGTIITCNKKSLKIIKHTEDEIINKNIKKIFKNIRFDSVLNNEKSIRDELIKVDDKDIIISAYPIINSDKFYGAVAIIKEFNEVEKKQHKIRKKLIGKGHKAKYKFDDIIGDSKKMIECKTIAKRMAKSNSSIIITGETGTGKELFAQAIHNDSLRKEYQFVAVNCGALPENILESELFGYEEGAFTGARKGGKIGLFELAHKGTIFLDEIGEMPINLQMKLLRVLQEKEIMRLGSDSVIDIDLRVIAATNKNLEKLIEEKKFREDLYYRLRVLPLEIPPLRNRREDIILIFDYFKNKFQGQFKLSKSAKDALISYDWKGNVRELRNFVEYFVNLGEKIIEVSDIPLKHEYIKIDDKINKKNDIEEFIKVTGKNINKYMFVLDTLRYGLERKERMGRRSIFRKAEDNKIFLTEQEIRRILNVLEKYSLIIINKGRGGSIITDYGLLLLDEMNK